MRNQKYQMFQHEFLVTSSKEKEVLGTMRVDDKGNKYVMAKAGATALAAGKITVAASIPATVINKAGTAHSAQAETLTLTIASATFAQDYFKGGQLHINDGDGEGHRYNIIGSSPVTAGAKIYITLDEGLREAMTTSSEFSLIPSPFQGTLISAVEESRPTGIPIMDVPAGHYYWSQMSGDALCLMDGANAVGSTLTLGSVAGSVTKLVGVVATTTATLTMPAIGYMGPTVGVDTEYKPIVLTLM
ncbi:MAG: hypothetical protein JEZ12_21575 [Desulfobacterium sp.]|nr:hypothetical protein [Desulfobacterium sp.]